MEAKGIEGWVWDPGVKLVRDSGSITIELDLTVRVYSGRFEAEYAWVYIHPRELGIAEFRDWAADTSGMYGCGGRYPVYSPQWRGNDQGGMDVPGLHADYEPERGARLITPEDRDFEYAKALLEAAYELDD